jgi:hypothetical protein
MTFKRFMIWLRWTMAVVVAVAVSQFLTAVGQTQSSYEGCLRVTADRAQDVLLYDISAEREFVLAAKTTGEESKKHLKSAKSTARAAQDRSNRTAPDPKGRRDFCHKQYSNFFFDLVN